MDKDKTENKTFSIDYAKEYLNFLADALHIMTYNRKIYNDFDTALKEQKANVNPFILWCLRNYYDSLIMKLSGFLEQPRYKDDQTFAGCIQELSEHKDVLSFWCMQQTAKTTSLITGKIIEHCIKEEMLEKLNEIDFEKDLKTIELFLNNIKTYRNKKIGHLTNTRVSNDGIPKIKDLHEIIDGMQKLMTKYFALFRISISNMVIMPGYGNFILKL